MNKMILLLSLFLSLNTFAAFAPMGDPVFSYGIIDYTAAPQILINYKNTGTQNDSLSNISLPSGYALGINRCTNINPNKTCYIRIVPDNIQPSDTPLSFSISGASISMTLYVKNAQGQLVAPTALQSAPQFQITSHSDSLDLSFDNATEPSKTVQLIIQNTGSSASVPQIQFVTNPANVRVMLNRCTSSLLPKKTCTISYLVPRIPNDSVQTQVLNISKNNVVQDSLTLNISGLVTLVPDVSFSSTLKSSQLALTQSDKKVSYITGSASFEWHQRWVYLSRRLPTASGKHYIEYIVKNGYNTIFGGNFSSVDPITFGGPFIPFHPANGNNIQIYPASQGGYITGSGGIYQPTGIEWDGSAQDTRVMIAVDFDNKKIWIGKNGTWVSGDNPTTNTGGADISPSLLTSPFFYMGVSQSTGSVEITDFPRYRPAGFQKMVSQPEQAIYSFKSKVAYNTFEDAIDNSQKTATLTLTNLGNKTETPTIQLSQNLINATIQSNQCTSPLAVLAECNIVFSFSKPQNNTFNSVTVKALKGSTEQDTAEVKVRGYMTDVGFFHTANNSPSNYSSGSLGIGYSQDLKTMSQSHFQNKTWGYLNKGLFIKNGKYYAEFLVSNFSSENFVGGVFYKDSVADLLSYDSINNVYGGSSGVYWEPYFNANGFNCLSFAKSIRHSNSRQSLEYDGVCGTPLRANSPITWSGLNSRVMVAIDFELKKMWVGSNGSFPVGDDPALGLGGADISLPIQEALNAGREFFHLGFANNGGYNFQLGTFYTNSTLIDYPLYQPNGFKNVSATSQILQGNINIVPQIIPDLAFISESENSLSTTISIINDGLGPELPSIEIIQNSVSADLIANTCISVLAPQQTCSVTIRVSRPANDVVGNFQLKVKTRNIQTDSITVGVRGISTVASIFEGSNLSPIGVTNDGVYFSSDRKTMIKNDTSKTGFWVSHLARGVPSNRGKYYAEFLVTGSVNPLIGGAFQNSAVPFYSHPQMDVNTYTNSGYTYSDWMVMSGAYGFSTGTQPYECTNSNSGNGGKSSFYQNNSSSIHINCGSDLTNDLSSVWNSSSPRVLMIAIDFDSQKLWIGMNGVWGYGSPIVGGAGHSISDIINFSRNDLFYPRYYFYLGVGFSSVQNNSNSGSIQIIDTPTYMPSGYLLY